MLPSWATLVRANNPGPMTLDGTNTWVLLPPDGGPAIVVDPGPDDEEHLRAVAALGPIGAILVTHGHPDHVEGLPRLVELTGATGEPSGLEVETIATPGHTADSVSFVVGTGGERAVLTGDTILGRGTTVLDGELGDYLASLERLATLGAIPVLPGHGPVLADCGAAARAYLAHRRERLDQVRTALAAGAVTASDVVRTVYADVDPALWPAAELSVRAQMAYLRRESSSYDPRLDGP